MAVFSTDICARGAARAFRTTSKRAKQTPTEPQPGAAGISIAPNDLRTSLI